MRSWVPVSVHAREHSGRPWGLSGVCLVDNGHTYVVTVVGLAEPSVGEYLVTCGDHMDAEAVRWTRFRWVRGRALGGMVRLQEVLQPMVAAGFQLEGGVGGSVVVLEPEGEWELPQGQAWLQAGPLAVGTRTHVHGCPYTFTDTFMFMGYVQPADVCLVAGEASQPAAYLSDSKYLENMTGGAVVVAGAVAGVVLGAVSKPGGQLMVVLPWSECGMEQVDAVPAAATAPAATTASLCVSPVVVRQGLLVLWGSGVWLSPTVLVTNRHVVLPEGARVLEVVVDGRALTHHDRVVAPLHHLDLAFVEFARLRSPGNWFPLLALPVLGASITTVAFGLVPPAPGAAPARPMVSHGEVTLTGPSAHLVSGSCFSGSSGGGVFSGARLVGILSHNGKLPLGEELTRFLGFIPAPLIAQGLRLLRSGTTATHLRPARPRDLLPRL